VYSTSGFLKDTHTHTFKLNKEHPCTNTPLGSAQRYFPLGLALTARLLRARCSAAVFLVSPEETDRGDPGPESPLAMPDRGDPGRELHDDLPDLDPPDLSDLDPESDSDFESI
jgi:hypothetical protein